MASPSQHWGTPTATKIAAMAYAWLPLSLGLNRHAWLKRCLQMGRLGLALLLATVALVSDVPLLVLGLLLLLATVAHASLVASPSPKPKQAARAAGVSQTERPAPPHMAVQTALSIPVLSGGADSLVFPESASLTLKGRCAPQRCWIDDIRAYAHNEVAINWNAPLVWLASELAAQRP